MAIIAHFEVKLWEKEYLEKELGKHIQVFFETVLDENNIHNVQDVEIIYSTVNKKNLDKLPKLKLITRSTGFDHIDLKECKKGRYMKGLHSKSCEYNTCS